MRFVKVKYGKITYPNYYLVVDDNLVWAAEQIELQKAKGRGICEMAFLDHGQPLIPEAAIPDISNYEPVYLNPSKGMITLVDEGGLFMPLLPEMEILEEVIHDKLHYPIKKGAAVICENDPFDKDHLDFMFKGMHPPSEGNIHYMFSFRYRSEDEVVAAFKNAPAILFWSSMKSADWFELLLRAYIISKSQAPIITKLGEDFGTMRNQRHKLAFDMAEKVGIKIYTSYTEFEQYQGQCQS